MTMGCPTIWVLWLVAAAAVANSVSESPASCPSRCICAGTAVRCMFLKLESVPQVAPDTTVLDLRFNNIRDLPAHAFHGLKHLHTLLLNNNRISKIEKDAFSGLESLQYLYLFKNEIRHLTKDVFQDLQHLEQLYLHQNRLEEIEEGTFSGLLSLERLFLNSNKIKRIYRGALQNLRQLRRLRLGANQLVCDCHLLWFSRMLKEKQTLTQATGFCHQPQSLRGRPLTSLTSRDFICRKPQLSEEPADVDVSLGAPARFSCKAVGEPKPDIVWFRNGNEVTSGVDGRITILDDGALNINSVNDDDKGTYNCQARNAAGEVSSKTAELRYIAHEGDESTKARKPRIIRPPSDISVMAGRSITLHCEADGYPTPEVTWSRDGLPMLQNARHHISRTAGMLIISATDLSDAGSYKCIASSSMGEDTATSVVQIEVPPTFIEPPREQEVAEDDNVEFICHVGGHPVPTITWYKDGKPIEGTDVRFKVITSGKVLRLYTVRKQDQGVYTCHIENSVTYAEAHADLLVTSKAAPTVLGISQATEVEEGSAVELSCIADGMPTPTVSWKRHGNPVSQDDPRLKMRRDGTLQIRRVHRDDRGEYECVAQNDMGQASSKSILNVKEPTESSHPGDKYFLSAFQEAQESVDKAISNTLQHILDKEAAAKNHHRLLRIFRYPDSEAQRRARAAEIFERVLSIIEQEVSSGAHFNLSGFSYSSLLSPSYLDLLGEKSGCLQHRQVPDCSDTCFHDRYRTYDGTCNNLQHPMYGASLTPFERLLPAQYENGFNTPIGWTTTKLVNGHTLPPARSVSSKIVSTEVVEGDSEHSHMLMQWGQFLDHDMDFSMPAISHERFIDNVDCSVSCDNSMPCFPIEVPDDDARVHGHRCIEFVRSSTACGSGRTSVFYGRISPREQTNQLTSFIDASNVYGSRAKQAIHLRNLTNNLGLLRVGPSMPSGKYLLPFNDGQPNDCKRDLEGTDVNCFLSGDVRANEQLGLLAMHTLWFREHNRIAETLHIINPHWNGERLYQEARKIVGAEMQHITYEHWLPKILGPRGMAIMRPYKGYDTNVIPSIVNVFATAALRFGHFLINPVLLRLDEEFKPIPEGHITLRRAFFAPHRLLREGGIDPLMRGLFVAPAKLRKADQLLNSELTDHLFEPALLVAQDLAAFNIQRGRDHGLPSYNQWREFCNLTKAQTFEDLKLEITSATLREKLEQAYKTPDNIDAWVGSISEEPVPGSKVGPTLLCLLSGQFARVRDGDRFWYENPGIFKPEQLEALRQASLSRVLCDNGDNITRVTWDAFAVPEKQTPQFLDCSQIPSVNLMLWKDSEQSNCTNENDVRSKRSVKSSAMVEHE
ncbi:peroxidasin homolog [Ornithodoros turicata]|uniref:peroxidasin homolog n=1 Tax=Ornithodoros turicata TaxID=34597 RepID=UPI00313885F7